ncbi:MAG: hypothetical protein ACI92G_002041 [Candidatus Pelagisphaera sp.]|jgi:hypothetical protein
MVGKFFQQVFGFLTRHPRLLNAHEESILNFLTVFFEVELLVLIFENRIIG